MTTPVVAMPTERIPAPARSSALLAGLGLEDALFGRPALGRRHHGRRDGRRPSRSSTPRGRGPWSRGTASGLTTGSPTLRRKETKPRLDQWLTCPGRVAQVAQVGAAGHVEAAPHGLARHGDQQVALATRAISARVWSGSGTCSSTSIALAKSNSSRSKGRSSAFCTRYSRFGRRRLSHSACSWGSSRSMPTTRPSPMRSAHSQTRTPSPQPTSRMRGGAGAREQLVERGGGSRPSGA